METSIFRECRLLGLHRSGYYKNKKDDAEVIETIRLKVETSRDGFWKIYGRLRADGHPWNNKRVYRVYKLVNFKDKRNLKKLFNQKYLMGHCPIRGIMTVYTI